MNHSARARRACRRQGFTLLVAIYAVMVIGMLMIALDVVTRAQTVVPEARKRAVVADAAIVAGLGYAVDEWRPEWRRLTAGGQFATSYPVPSGTVDVVGTREDSAMVRFQLTARMTNGTSKQKTVRMLSPYLTLPWNGVLITNGAVVISPGFQFYSTDSPPPNGADCIWADDSHEPMVVARDGSQVSGANGANYTGAAPLGPLVVQDPTLTSTSLGDYGLLSVADLVALRQLTLSSGQSINPSTAYLLTPQTVDGEILCWNWGDPWTNNGCQTNYPIIYAPGPVTLTGGSAQGILIADGTVTMQNDAWFLGVIIVANGDLIVDGPNAQILGKAIMMQPNSTAYLRQGGVRQSTCSVKRLNFARTLSRPILTGNLRDVLFGTENR